MKGQMNVGKKLNNKGLSLVELLLSIMILAIVSSSVFAFMIFGGRTFKRSNEETDMQAEAQVMKNYMNDLITDAAKGVEFVKKADGGETYEADCCLTIYGEKVVSFLAWREDTNKVYYLEKKNFTINADGSYSINFGANDKNAANWPVLAEYVSGFDCNLTDLQAEHRIFTAALAFSMGKSTYNTTHTITLRNDIFYTGMGNTPGQGGVSTNSYITGITLQPAFTDKSKGSTVVYSANVSAVGSIDDSVTFLVEGNNSANTRMEGNVLHIGSDETASMLTVICKANIDENISATGIVNVTNVSSIAINPINKPNYKDAFYYPGTIIDFAANVEGNFISSDGSAVTWEIIDSENKATILASDDKTCRIQLGPKLNHEIVLKATSKADARVSREYIVRSADIDIGDLYINAVGGAFKVKRDGSLQLQLLVSGQAAGNDKLVAWSILDNPLGSKVTIDNTGKITAAADVPYANQYELMVQAQVTDLTAGGNTETVTCKVMIEPVQIAFDPSYALVVSREKESNSNNVSTNPTRVAIEVKGLNMENKELSIQQKPYVRGLEHWIADVQGDKVVLALNMSLEKPQTGKATLKISLKQDSSVYAQIQAYFLSYNQIYGGKYVYIPVPGDVLNFITDQNNKGVPDTTGEVTINGYKYGYTNVTVNGVVYHYYVDKENADPNVTWYVTIGNEVKKYIYNNITKMYEEYNSTP